MLSFWETFDDDYAWMPETTKKIARPFDLVKTTIDNYIIYL